MRVLINTKTTQKKYKTNMNDCFAYEHNTKMIININTTPAHQSLLLQQNISTLFWILLSKQLPCLNSLSNVYSGFKIILNFMQLCFSI